MTIKSGTGQACAACKYQRRRCTSECLLRPFFPADQPKTFQHVHRLFGVKNIQNLLKEISPDQRHMAMTSIKFHAAMRDKYPVYGCLVEIQQITYQIQMAEEELKAVLQQLAYYRRQREVSATTEYLSELQLGIDSPGKTAMELPIGPQISSYSNSCNADYGIRYLDFKENNVVDSLCREAYNNSADNNTDSMVMQSQAMTVQEDTAQDYNEMHPFFDHIEDTKSYVDSKEAYESSLESPLKDSRSQLFEQMDENELKSAAACFSLTSII